MKIQFLLVFAISLLYSGCVEIIDDLSLNHDGSGTFKYNVNLSSSKVKINSVLALDSLDGKRVPTIGEISNRVNEITDLLKTKDGISNVEMISDYDNYIFKLSFDFENLAVLQNSIKEIAMRENKGKEIPELEHKWLEYNGEYLARSIPKITLKKVQEIKIEDRKLLHEGTYTSITRFENEILDAENPSSKFSKNNMAVMIRTDPYSLIENPGLLDNRIRIDKTEK